MDDNTLTFINTLYPFTDLISIYIFFSLNEYIRNFQIQQI